MAFLHKREGWVGKERIDAHQGQSRHQEEPGARLKRVCDVSSAACT